MPELPYWTDILADPSAIWRTFLWWGTGTLAGVLIIIVADALQYPRWLAQKRDSCLKSPK